jgi:hypothetical protein
MKILIILTLFFCTHSFVPLPVSATISSKNQRYTTCVPTKKITYKRRVVVKFLQLKSKFSPDRKMARLTLIEAAVCLLVGLGLLYYSSGSGRTSNNSQSFDFGPIIAQIFALIFGVFLLIVSVVLFIAAFITALN